MSLRRLNLSLLVLVLGSLSASCSQAQASRPESATEVSYSDQSPIAQDSSAHYAQVVSPCPYSDSYPNFYVQVVTNDGDPLRVRSRPNGRVVGAAQDGWNVRLLEWSRDGAWARITSPWSSPGIGNGSGEGWVSAAYVKEVGRFCSKPRGVAELVQPEVFGAEPVQVQSDWLAMGDVLSEDL